MDLKGSIVDTNLRIYPSDKCLKFLETLADQDGVPNNIVKLLKLNKREAKNGISKEPSLKIQLTDEDIKNLNTIKELMGKDESRNQDKEKANKHSINSKDNDQTNVTQDSDSASNNVDGNTNNTASDKYKDKEHLTTKDIEWLYLYLNKKRSKGGNTPYLHELLEDSHIETPENQVLKRNPILEARCVKLRAQQEAREYRAMTKGVDNVRIRYPEDSISYQCKFI